MDSIVKVEFDTVEQDEEFYRAVHNINGVEIVTQYELGYRVQGDEESFDSLIEQLKEQQQEEANHNQYEYVRANKEARSQFNKARND